MADIEESNKRPLEVEGDDQEAETAAKKTKVDEAPADSDATEETGSSAVADDVTETAAVSEAAAADEADKKTSEEEKKPAEDSSAAPKAENTASAPKFGSFGGTRFGAVSSAPRGGFGAAAKTSSGFGSGFGAASAGEGGGIWAKAAAQFAKPTGFGTVAAKKSEDTAAASDSNTNDASDASDGEEEEKDDGVEATGSFQESKELVPGLSADYDYKTGEEDEDVLYHCRAKLHHLNAAQKTWTSLGEGTLNLNVKKEKDSTGQRQARIVLRCLGSMKLLLNVRIWDGMAIEMVGLKQIRFLAVETDDTGNPKVSTYLVTISRQDCGVLYEKIKGQVKVVTAANNGTAEDADEAGTASVAVTFTKAETNLQAIARESMASTS